jgi:two-component system response regulator AtoC
VDVRVMAATHIDFDSAIADRKFREDLYYRLNVINLHVPALRDRKDDLMPLTEFLIQRHLGPSAPMPVVTEELKHAMMTYHWPGNVRELENFVRRLIILRDPAFLARELRERTMRKPLMVVTSSGSRTGALAASESLSPILEQVTKAKQHAEVDAILAALHSTRWNRKRAASLLKIDYKALLYKMKRLGIEGKAAPAVDSEHHAIAATMAAGKS